MITFDNVTVDGCTTSFFRLLERSKQGGLDAAPDLQQALARLVGVEVARAREGTDPARLAAFRRDYADSPAVQAIVAADVERADRELRRVGAEQPEPLPARLVPAGLPSSHWWWCHP